MSALSKILLGFLILAALLATLVFLLPSEQRADLLSALPALQGKLTGTNAELPEEASEEDDEAPRRLRFVDGVPAVRLTVKEQRVSGIRAAPLKRIAFRAERVAYGEVVDIQSLLRLRIQHDMARARQRIARARLQVSLQVYERLRGLNEVGNVISASRVREAQSRWRIDQARLTAAKARVENIRAQAVQAWGQIITAEAVGADSRQIEQLIDQEDVLLRITLAPGQHLSPSTQVAFVDRNGNRRRARKAFLISPAPSTDPASQGETWFFHVAAEDLRIGMRVTAWIPRDKAPATGILVPAAAAVWYGGKPWVYVGIGEELFARRAAPVANEVARGWVAREGFGVGETVVVSGGQMLLSEEFRWQIPEEDDD